MEPIIIEELARMLEDQGAERGRREGAEIGRREGAEIGRREGAEIGRREGAAITLRRAIVDLAEVCGAPLDEQRRAWIADASVEELEQARIALKRDRGWPA